MYVSHRLTRTVTKITHSGDVLHVSYAHPNVYKVHPNKNMSTEPSWGIVSLGIVSLSQEAIYSNLHVFEASK